LQFSTGRQGYGSFEPPYTSIDQTDWTGGLGQLKYTDTSKFYDSYNMWTLTPDVLMPAPLWRFAKGVCSASADPAVPAPENIWMPGDTLTAGGSRNTTVSWQSMAGNDNSQYLAHKFTTIDKGAGAWGEVDRIWLLMKFNKSTAGAYPGALRVSVYTDNSNPNTEVANSSATLTLTSALEPRATPEGELVGQLVCFEIAQETLTGATDYWVVIKCADADRTDGTAGYFEIAYGDNGGTAARSSDGSSWTATNARTFFYALHSADLGYDAKIHFQEYKRQLYCVTEPPDGTDGKVYMNGDRGVATGTSTTSLLKDTTKSWTNDEWNGCWVHIWNGTGEGQFRKIVDNTSTDLIVYDAAETHSLGKGRLFDVTPTAGAADTGSEYNILGSDTWIEVTPSTQSGEPLVFEVSGPFTDTLTLWGMFYIAQGEKGYLFKVREYNDSGTWKNFHYTNSDANSCEYDGTNYALFLEKTYDPVNENKIWVARNLAPGEWASATQTSVYSADDVLWPNDLALSNPIPIGTRDYLITGMTKYNNRLWVGKEDSVWYVDFDGTYNRAYPLDVGLDAISSPNNCKAMAAQDLYLYFNFSHSVERMYGGTLDDVGPWRGAGLIERATGDIVHLEPSLGWIFGALDGESNKQSSLLAYQFGWHTLFRAPTVVLDANFGGRNANPRIRSCHWQSISGEDSLHRLWFEMGGYIMFMDMPSASLNPAQDSNMYFAPESYVVQSHQDAGYAELEKYYGKGRIVCNATDGTIAMDYDVNPDLYNLSWAKATASAANADPSHEYSFGATEGSGQSRKRNAMVRTRISTSTINDSSKNNILAVVLDAFARKPVKYNWEMRIKLKDNAKTLTGAEDHTNDALMDQLRTWSGQAQALTMRSADFHADNSGAGRTVVVEPPGPFREAWNKAKQKLFGYATVTLREL
jgi:hypothetical protein